MSRTGVQAVARQRQMVVFELENELYGVDIHQVQEIIRVPAITHVPRTPDFVEGVINLRGNVIPILDLRKRFGFGPGGDDNDKRIVVVEMGDKTLGVIVDAVTEVLLVDEDAVEPPSPYIVTVDSQYIVGVARLKEQLIIVLDLNQVLSMGERDDLTRMEREKRADVDL